MLYFLFQDVISGYDHTSCRYFGRGIAFGAKQEVLQQIELILVKRVVSCIIVCTIGFADACSVNGGVV